MILQQAVEVVRKEKVFEELLHQIVARLRLGGQTPGRINAARDPQGWLLRRNHQAENSKNGIFKHLMIEKPSIELHYHDSLSPLKVFTLAVYLKKRKSKRKSSCRFYHSMYTLSHFVIIYDSQVSRQCFVLPHFALHCIQTMFAPNLTCQIALKILFPAGDSVD